MLSRVGREGRQCRSPRASSVIPVGCSISHPFLTRLYYVVCAGKVSPYLTSHAYVGHSASHARCTAEAATVTRRICALERIDTYIYDSGLCVSGRFMSHGT